MKVFYYNRWVYLFKKYTFAPQNKKGEFNQQIIKCKLLNQRT